jgi:hypothetical protein
MTVAQLVVTPAGSLGLLALAWYCVDPHRAGWAALAAGGGMEGDRAVDPSGLRWPRARRARVPPPRRGRAITWRRDMRIVWTPRGRVPLPRRNLLAEPRRLTAGLLASA